MAVNTINISINEGKYAIFCIFLSRRHRMVLNGAILPNYLPP